MLAPLFGNENASRVLLYIANYGDGYAAGIARTFGVPLYAVQRQLLRLEQGGIVASTMVGRTRLYRINPRYPLRKELTALLDRALRYLPEEETKRHYRQRRRPIQPGKR